MAVFREEFSTVRDGLTLRGYVYRQRELEQDYSCPIVILCHGFLADQSTTAEYARYFARHGYVALTFDFAGGCLLGRSDGSLAHDMTLSSECRDLKAVLSYARKNLIADASRISLMGLSQGGLVCAMTAADPSLSIERLILFYPALCIPDDARKGCMMFFHFDPEDIPEEIIGLIPLRLNGAYAKEAQQLDVHAAITPYRGPVLIVHGKADRIVNYEYSLKAAEAYRATRHKTKDAPVKLYLIDRAGHGFGRILDLQALAYVDTFIDEE